MSDGPAQQQAKKSETVKREEAVLAFWRENRIFEKTLEKDSPQGEFVFNDGPPFATGLPHYGSLLSSIVKDVIPRYKTMRGFHVRRRWGWDCHGLPIENMIEKELGLKSKRDILKLGVDTFNEACRASVLRYAQDWKEYVERIGRWVEFDNAYKTMDNAYIESVWWALKNIYKKDLLYEGRRVLLYCPRCETPLAKAEIAMDNSYKEITEEAVYVKFKVNNPQESGLPENTYLLAWTTTPWTLPGNVALAVGADIEYALLKSSEADEYYIIAQETLQLTIRGNDEPVSKRAVAKTLPGKDLIGLSYEPLFDIQKVQDAGKENAWTVLPADFVTTDEGTGIVHTAVIYGEDDYRLGQERDLPMVPLLDASGKFNDDAPEQLRGMYFKDAEKIIKDELAERNLLFKREQYTHAYPHCHRCSTPLLYNAVNSWFINIQNIKDRMLATNEEINWFPEHLKHGRYQNILENAPDWTISRNRFWASPLPIWRKEHTNELVFIGSLGELTAHTKRSGNRYFIVRHGQSRSNVEGYTNGTFDEENTLTELGKANAQSAAEELRTHGVTRIYHSLLPRTRDTARIIAEVLGLPAERVQVDERLRENEFGVLEGRSLDEYHAFYDTQFEKLSKAPKGGETWHDTKTRMTEALYDIEKRHQDDVIAIVSHNGPLEMLQAGAAGFDDRQAGEALEDGRFLVGNGEVRELPFVPLPHNRDYELDLHRPYIDELALVAKDGSPLTRVPEVIDGWVESGSMPFAEYHYPFEHEAEFTTRFPGDFIAEYIAQTRTWFYYMHAMAVLLFDEASFKNVVTTGNILAEDGSKMSKSKGNYTDPLLNLDRFGADALRYYLMASVVMQAEDMRFMDEELREIHNRVVNILVNSVHFYELYKGEAHDQVEATTSSHVLDQWILARLAETAAEITKQFDAYDTVRATRPIRDFVSDFSTWYIRRSRDRFKSDDTEDRTYALATTKQVIQTLAKIIAPVMPFIAEHIYRVADGEQESVHLEDWPEAGEVDEKVLAGMQRAREIVSEALEQRAAAGIKARQPLSSLTIPEDLSEEYRALIADEVNVKEVVQADTLKLETAITPELQREGDTRELIRHIQDMRKKAGLTPQDRVSISIATDEAGQALIHAFERDIKTTAGITDIACTDTDGSAVDTATASFTVSLEAHTRNDS